MVPDRGFTKQLKMLDPELEVKWDWGAEKWEIWCVPKEEGKDSYLVTRVQTKDKTYRELGQDVLLGIQMHMKIGVENILNYLDEHNNQLQRRRRKAFKDKIKSMATDTFGHVFDTPFAQVPKEYLLEKPKTQKILEVI